MTYSSKITAKGQATIPKPIRDFLGLRAHDLIRFELKEGKVVVEPVKKTILDFKGMLKGEKPFQDWNDIRSEVKREVARHAVEG